MAAADRQNDSLPLQPLVPLARCEARCRRPAKAAAGHATMARRCTTRYEAQGPIASRIIHRRSMASLVTGRSQPQIERCKVHAAREERGGGSIIHPLRRRGWSMRAAAMKRGRLRAGSTQRATRHAMKRGVREGSKGCPRARARFGSAARAAHRGFMAVPPLRISHSRVDPSSTGGADHRSKGKGELYKQDRR